MNGEHVRKQVDESVEQLMRHLDRGRSEQMKAYLSAMGRFHRYSWGNVLLIAMQRPDATRVAGYQTWRKLGRQVKRGERGLAILAPILQRVRSCSEKEDDPDRVFESIAGFKAAYVFDISQTDGKPLPDSTHVQGDAGQLLGQLKAFIAGLGIDLGYFDSFGAIDGASSGGEIRIRRGMPTAREFSVGVHELAHELLHQNGEQKPSKTVRETEAEAVAFVVCEAFGLDVNTAASDYIGLYDGKRETLVQSLERIQRTASRIIDGVSSQPAVKGADRAEMPAIVGQAA
ncbi:MAG: DUF1738 domain-containing protein [Phycisphaerae bacterium]|nr:DUF1738 domain-containing protein [Phycisphaerae bacterium]